MKTTEGMSIIDIFACRAQESELITKCSTLHPAWRLVQATIVLRKRPHVLAQIPMAATILLPATWAWSCKHISINIIL